MDKNVEALAAQPFFEEIDSCYLKQIADAVSYETVDQGDYLFRVGDKADRFYLIESGKINILTEKLENQDFDQPAPVAIQTLGAGEVVGWSWFLEPYEWRFDAKVVEGPAKLITVEAKHLRAQCEEDPTLGYEILKRLLGAVSERLTATRMQLAISNSKPFSQCEGG